MRAWLLEQPNVNPQKIDVHIHRIIDAGVELTLTLYLTTLDGGEETACREAIHCQILTLADQLGVMLASTQQPLDQPIRWPCTRACPESRPERE